MKPYVKPSFALMVSFLLPAVSPAIAAEKIWTEQSPDTKPLVDLPDFSPIINAVDAAIVNVASSTEPKPNQQHELRRRNRPQGSPEELDPFANPEEFFEKFFGQQFRDMPQQQRKALGSGFIISKDGYILTNNHVIEGFDKIEISLLEKKGTAKKGQEFTAKLVGRDPATDVALLKIDAGFPLHFVPLGNSAKVKKGDWVLAFGNPFGLDHSVSKGIISAVGRQITPNNNRRFDDFLQTDAAINFGNSGGPLVNMKAEVIGINTAITAQGSGIGFAVPINITKDVLPSLQKSGSVPRGYLGIMIQDITEDMTDRFGLKKAEGVLVNDLVPNGPAAKSDLRRGDVILKVNGETVDDATALQRLIAKVPPGEKAELEVMRKKKTLKIFVKTGNLSEGTGTPEKKKDDSEKSDRLGIVVSLGAEGQVVVDDLDETSIAAKAGLAPGDIVLDIDGNSIQSVSDYNKAVKGLKSKQKVVFYIERRDAGGLRKFYIGFKVP